MKTVIRKLGNSQGILIPKPLLAQIGLENEAEMSVEDGALVLRPTRRHPREGWAAASRKLADAGADALVWPEFGNQDDTQLKW